MSYIYFESNVCPRNDIFTHNIPDMRIIFGDDNRNSMAVELCRWRTYHPFDTESIDEISEIITPELF